MLNLAAEQVLVRSLLRLLLQEVLAEVVCGAVAAVAMVETIIPVQLLLPRATVGLVAHLLSAEVVLLEQRQPQVQPVVMTLGSEAVTVVAVVAVVLPPVFPVLLAVLAALKAVVVAAAEPDREVPVLVVELVAKAVTAGP